MLILVFMLPPQLTECLEQAVIKLVWLPAHCKKNLTSGARPEYWWDLYSPRNDPDPEMIPNPELIPKLTLKWSRPRNDPQIFNANPEMIPK